MKADVSAPTLSGSHVDSRAKPGPDTRMATARGLTKEPEVTTEGRRDLLRRHRNSRGVPPAAVCRFPHSCARHRNPARPGPWAERTPPAPQTRRCSHPCNEHRDEVKGEIAVLRYASCSAARVMRRARSVLNEFKRIALRADKTDQSFDAIIHLAAAVISTGLSLAQISSPGCCTPPLPPTVKDLI